ncbi:MAG: hypothetical protein MUE41_07100, partial [Gemmatimonadaceae bacterium]|nr:hypothetical protein [Gemmatimonadaceae bacterium]
MRLVLLLDGLVMPAWQARAIELALEQPGVTMPCVILNAAPPGPVASSALTSYWRNRDVLLYSAFMRIDGRRAHVAQDPFAMVDATPLFAGVERMSVTP